MMTLVDRFLRFLSSWELLDWERRPVVVGVLGSENLGKRSDFPRLLSAIGDRWDGVPNPRFGIG